MKLYKNILRLKTTYIECCIIGGRKNKLEYYYHQKEIRLNVKNNFLRLVTSTKCKVALVEMALCLVHADDQMLGIDGVF